MTLSSIAKKAEKLVADNSPAILTAVGVTGTVTTAYLTGKASFKAAEILREEQFKVNIKSSTVKKDLTAREKTEIVWKLYIPAVGTGVLTVSSIILANRIGTRRAAAMAAAYSISERAFTEYKEKVIEKIGENKEHAIREEIAQDRVARTPVPQGMITPPPGKVICFDAFSGRYTFSNMEALRRAENEINYQILHNDFASLTDFYTMLKMEPTSQSDELGWNTDKKFQLHTDSILTPDDHELYPNQPILTFDFAVVPIRDYWRFC